LIYTTYLLEFPFAKTREAYSFPRLSNWDDPDIWTG